MEEAQFQRMEEDHPYLNLYRPPKRQPSLRPRGPTILRSTIQVVVVAVAAAASSTSEAATGALALRCLARPLAPSAVCSGATTFLVACGVVVFRMGGCGMVGHLELMLPRLMARH